MFQGDSPPSMTSTVYPHNDIPSPSVTDETILEDMNSSPSTSDSFPTASAAPDCSLDVNQTNLIVNYLPPAMSQEDIRALFANVGELDSCKLVRDKTTGSIGLCIK